VYSYYYGHCTTIFPVVLCGCETWSLPLREEHRPRASENRVLRKILGPKRDEVKGDWRKFLNKELHDLCSSANIIQVITSRRWARHVARREKSGTYRILMENYKCLKHKSIILNHFYYFKLTIFYFNSTQVHNFDTICSACMLLYKPL
jgi:hypothetical protein